MGRYLYVDDNPESALGSLQEELGDVAVVDMSTEGWQADLERFALHTDIVIYDYRLDENVGNAVSPLYPRDGVAANALVRSLERRDEYGGKMHAILSGAYVSPTDSFEFSDDPLIRAFQLEADWSGRKDSVPAFSSGLREFAAALDLVRALRTEAAEESIKAVLSLKPSSWSARAWEEVVQFGPPIGNPAETPVRLVRWLSSTAVPFPSFIVDTSLAALRLGVDVDWFRHQRFFFEQIECRYQGALSQLAGPRWWRVGLDQWLWEETGGRPQDAEAICRAMHAATGAEPRLLQPSLVPVHDLWGAGTGELVAIQDALRFRPVYWPLACGTAWTPRERAQASRKLRDRVIPEEI